MLSREEVELYRRDGYLPGRRLLSAREAERLRDDCLRNCAEPLVLGDQNPYSLKRHASNRVSRVEDWRAGKAEAFDRATFPAPSTSNAACGFPALRSPICFTSRLIGPIQPGRLSACRVALDSR